MAIGAECSGAGHRRRVTITSVAEVPGEVWGRVAVRGLRCVMADGSVVLVDVSVGVDLGPAAQSDVLEDAVDLAALAETVRAVLTGPTRTLLETVAVEICRRMIDTLPAVQDVHLVVRKPEPAGLDAAEEAVELTVHRPTIGGRAQI